MSEEKNKFIALYHFLDKPQDFNLEMNYYEFRDELKNLLDLYQKEKEKNKELSEKVTQNICNRVEAEVLEEYRLKVQNSISKDKIKELIDKINIDGYSCQECIGEIIELLEERN